MERHVLHSWSQTKGRVRRDTRGFTMVELVIASFVMIMVLAGSLLVFGSSLKAVETARNSTIAGQIMQTEIEKLRLLSWTDITTKTAADHSFTVNHAETVSYTCHRTITPDPARATMLNITLTAQWKNRDGSTHSRSYSTRYAKNGLSDYYVTHR